MRSRIHAVVLPSEAGEFADDVRRIFAELGRTLGEQLTGECSPAIDVYETDETVEITADMPAVAPDALRIVAKGQTILIAGLKIPRRSRGDSSFHLVERGYGRFARTVRLTAACDSSRARASIVDGELRLSLPKIVERRDAAIRIPITPRAH
ncbi:MAG TPA: Hsp20/alpha crystallin family protein [Vicinamibacterales bacterium]|jgi:HSP20 family protein